MSEPKTKTVEWLRTLAHAIRTLDAEQGSRARRNARACVSRAVRGLREWVDEEYPAPPRKSVTHRTYDDVASRLKAQLRSFRADGWVQASDVLLRVWAPVCGPTRHDRTGCVWVPR